MRVVDDLRHIWNVISNKRSKYSHHPTSPNTAPATQNACRRWSAWLNCDCTELWLYWTVTLLNCDCTELLLYWTVTLLNYYFTELWLDWSVTWLKCDFTELLLYCTVTVLNCDCTEVLPYWTVTVLNRDCTELWLYWSVTLLNCYFTELWLYWTVTVLNCYFTELLLNSTVALLNCYFTELWLYWTVTWLNCYFTELLLYWTVTLLNYYFTEFLAFLKVRNSEVSHPNFLWSYPSFEVDRGKDIHDGSSSILFRTEWLFDWVQVASKHNIVLLKVGSLKSQVCLCLREAGTSASVWRVGKVISKGQVLAGNERGNMDLVTQDWGRTIIGY